ncbi:MAG: hypothetical protein ACOCUU_02645 [Nanoarchaeota archaeon]
MLISRWKIKQTIEEQSVREETQRGMQPSLALSCFHSLRKENIPVEDTKTYCEECVHYRKTCEPYLRSFEIKEKLHKEY